MKKAKLVQAMFTQEETAAINTKNIKLEEENEILKKELGILNCKGGTPELVGHAEFVRFLIEENKSLKEENEKLKAELEKIGLTKEQAKDIAEKLIQDLDSWINLDCLYEPSYDGEGTLYDELVNEFSDFIYYKVNKCLQ